MTVENGSREALGYWRDWCLSPTGKSAASRAAASPPASPLRDLRRAAAIEHLGHGEERRQTPG
jgi:hypothetical protein